MRDQERLTRPVVVSLPAEIDIANAEHVGEQLRAAFALDVVAELGLTVFCCTSGSHQLVAARKKGEELVHKSRARNRGLLSLKSCEAK